MFSTSKSASLPKSDPGIVYWQRLTEHDAQHVVLVDPRVRRDLAWFAVIYFFIAVWEVFFCFMLAAALKQWHQPHADARSLVAVVSFFMFIGLFAAILLAVIFPSMMVTRAEFLLPQQTTVLTCFWLFKRRIPALPSSVEVSSRCTKGFYTGLAVLKYKSRRFHLPLLYTSDGSINSYSAAESRAAEATADLRQLLNLELTHRSDNVLAAGDRASALFCGLIAAFISCALLYGVFSGGEIHGTSIPLISQSANRLIGQIILTSGGTLLALAAIYCFWLVIKPNPRRKKK